MKKVLLFGFETLPEILTVAGIVQQFGGEAVPVTKEGCGLTLEALAQGKTGRGSGVPIGGEDAGILRFGAGVGRPVGGAASGRGRVPEGGADAGQPKLDAGTALPGASAGTPGYGEGIE